MIKSNILIKYLLAYTHIHTLIVVVFLKLVYYCFKVMKNKFLENFLFISTRLTIKNNHLNKNDVRKIKGELAKKLGAVALLISVGFLLACTFLMISMSVATNGRLIETYGTLSFTGQAVGIVGSLLAIVLEIIGLRSKNETTKVIVARIALNSLYLVILFSLISFFFADAKQGFLNETETLSASVIIVTLLVLIQPAFWIDSSVAGILTSGSIIVSAIIAYYIYNIKGLHYYIIIGTLFPLVGYLVISILFYAEAQRYCVELRNEVLNNTAMYDELTHCKNRHALREFLVENAKRWDTKNVHLLLIMFDIDNFKEYNDQFSHPGGDYCLKSIAEAIRREFPSPGLDFFRYGGEEFLLFFEIENTSDAPEIMKRVRNAVRDLKIDAPEGAPKSMVTISVGGSVINTSEVFSFDKQLKVVDSYLYQAKRSGKDMCIIDGSVIEDK